jgi:hypothetical protein
VHLVAATFQAHTGTPRTFGTMFHLSPVVKQKSASMKHILFHLRPFAGKQTGLSLKIVLLTLKSDIYIERHQACYSMATT